jgi:hypothetical protein
MTRASLTPVVVAGLLSAFACGPGLAGARAPAPGASQPASIVIPPGRPPRVTMSTQEASLMFPELDKMDRDPFLTEVEEHPEKAPVVVAVVDTKKVVKKKAPAGPKPLVLKQLHESVTGIINGPRNTFFFQGKLFEEGDTLPDSDWVVISIKETGIRLRSKDGATDFLPFATDMGGSIIIKKNAP